MLALRGRIPEKGESRYHRYGCIRVPNPRRVAHNESVSKCETNAATATVASVGQDI